MKVEKGAIVRDLVIMNDTIIRAGAVVDCCVLDKEVEAGAVIGRNCRIDPSTVQEDYASLEVPSGETISKKPEN